ncbi:metalloregulator ArsR/SmtB family transcription factor [Persicobacter diffluens]|uniref:HTH arsR-type domain-containing protein n=1 Tax=Persicobacter diffluens TaxID=981 RepID=A0AAN4VZH3_9BACT|nr:hypothetical protein PEDI_34910 [Persicobacter diffluens]
MKVKQTAKIFKALSNENRLELFLQIAQAEQASFEEPTCDGCFVQHIAAKLNLGAPTISHHLKELVNAELIHTEKAGKNVVARVNRETLQLVIALLKL